VSVQDHGKRHWRRADTYEKAQERLAQLIANMQRGKTDGLRAKERRQRAEAVILQVLDVASAEGWSNQTIAAALACQLSPRRIKFSITGPCVYCGTWAASTIDHIVPLSAGGTDDPANLTSACWRCNSKKGNQPVARMIRANLGGSACESNAPDSA
jgi:5-methylcytosine-specific restriction endonuclease McrA